MSLALPPSLVHNDHKLADQGQKTTHCHIECKLMTLLRSRIGRPDKPCNLQLWVH